jgi:hypothetical protein
MVEEVSRYRNMFAESYGVNEEIMGDLEYDE